MVNGGCYTNSTHFIVLENEFYIYFVTYYAQHFHRDMALKLRNQVLAKANLFVDKLKILLAPYGTAMDNKQKANINTFFARVVSKIKQIKYNSHFAQLRLVKLTRDEIEKNFFEYCKTTTQPRLDLAVIGWNRIKHIIGDLPFCISAYIPTVVVTQIAIDNKVETNAVEYVKLQCGELVAKIERGMQTAYDGHDSEVNDRFRKIRDEEIPGKYAELEAFKKLPKTGFGGLFEKYA